MNVLELIDGATIRDRRPDDEASYFKAMFVYVQKMHEMGVAHFDLKKKDNLLVEKGDRPRFIDLGVSIIYKPGFHPLNHYLFRLAKKFDYNAWIRHKYQRDVSRITPEDEPFYNKTLIEIYTLKLKRFYKDKLKPLFKR